jgi:hypothetical protein
MFALKLVKLSEDKKEFRIKLSWQTRLEGLEAGGLVALTTPALSSRGLTGVNGHALTDYRGGGQAAIVSGTEFLLATDDPDKRPLPNIELLEVQWFLDRVMGMAGPVMD